MVAAVPDRVPTPRPQATKDAMRFFEFEAREVVKRAGIPVTDYGFTTDPAEAKADSRAYRRPHRIKSQVLTGGRMKAGA